MDHRDGGRFVRRFLVALEMSFSAGVAWSQTAEIRVDVTDSSGAFMVGVSVAVTAIDTGVTHAYLTDSVLPR